MTVPGDPNQPPVEPSVEQEPAVSVQTWVRGQARYQEVVDRHNVPGTQWALVTLDENGEPDDREPIPVEF